MRTATFSLLTLLLAASVAGAAAPPSMMNYQGVLRDATDQPLDGSYDITFRFFDAAALGNEILIDAHTGVDAVVVDNGLFSAGLGTGNVSDGSAALPNDPYLALEQVFGDFSDVWLELEIEGETLSPRVRVMAAAYALNAQSLDGFDAGDVLVDMSSSEPSGTIALAADLAARGIEMIDSPVSGGRAKAVEGTLTLMVGGADAVISAP